jgi:hypothetical protein
MWPDACVLPLARVRPGMNVSFSSGANRQRTKSLNGKWKFAATQPYFYYIR